MADVSLVRRGRSWTFGNDISTDLIMPGAILWGHVKGADARRAAIMPNRPGWAERDAEQARADVRAEVAAVGDQLVHADHAAVFFGHPRRHARAQIVVERHLTRRVGRESVRVAARDDGLEDLPDRLPVGSRGRADGHGAISFFHRGEDGTAASMRSAARQAHVVPFRS